MGLQHGSTGDRIGDRNVLCLHCITINMNILVVITYYNFARRNHRGKLGDGSINLIELFLRNTCESTQNSLILKINLIG